MKLHLESFPSSGSGREGNGYVSHTDDAFSKQKHNNIVQVYTHEHYFLELEK